MGILSWIIKCVVCGWEEGLDLEIDSHNPARDICRGCRDKSEARNAENIRLTRSLKSLPNRAERVKK